MAPKKAEMTKNPPLASSSEEGEEESGSYEEESGSSGEESNKNESSDDEQSKPTQTSAVPVAAKSHESDSEGESESDSEPETAEKKTSGSSAVSLPESSTAKPSLTQTEGESESESESDSDSDPETAEKKTSGPSAVSLPESSTAKRSLTQSEDGAKKKMKVSTTEHVKKPAADEEVKKTSGGVTKQQLFQRKFSETDEIALLQGILDFSSKRGDPMKEMDLFCDYVKKLMDFNANKSQLVTKIQRLKKKFNKTVNHWLKKGKNEDQIELRKDLDQKSFELSRKIWGNNGVMAPKSTKKVLGNPKEIKPSLMPQKVAERKKPETNLVNTRREMASFLKVENATALGLDESTVSAGWEMVADGPKKRELEEKLKQLKASHMELCLERIGLIADFAKVIFEDNASTSGM